MQPPAGILPILGAHLALCGELAIIHALGASVPLTAILLVRGLGAALLVGVILRRRGQGWAALYSARPGFHLTRAIASVTGFWAFVLLYARLPLLEATAISYLVPLFAALLAWPVLGERLTPSRAAAVGIAFAGALLVIRPSAATLGPVHLAALLAPLIAAGTMMMTRVASRDEPSEVALAWFALVSIVGGLPALAPSADLPTEAWAGLLAIAGLGTLGTWLRLRAFAVAEVPALAPYEYTRIAINAVLAVLLFGQWPSGMEAAGTALILGACLMGGARRRAVAELVPPRKMH